MRALKIVVRLALATVGGWYAAMLLLWALAIAVDWSVWGVFHTGAPIILWPLLAFLLYWLLGHLPPLRSQSYGGANSGQASTEDPRTTIE
jgi:hypothetical protein